MRAGFSCGQGKLGYQYSGGIKFHVFRYLISAFVDLFGGYCTGPISGVFIEVIKRKMENSRWMAQCSQ
jgi:hypothetical protein